METSRRKTSTKPCTLLGMFLALTVLGSCGNDDLADSIQPQTVQSPLRFGVNTGGQWNTGNSTRSVAVADSVQTFTFGDGSLCTVSTYDGIGEPTQPTTRGVAITEDTFYDYFNVDAYVTNSEGKATQYIQNETVTKQGESSVWSTNEVKYWPGAGYVMDFFAYAPDKVGGDGELTYATDSSNPTISYTVPSDVKEQADLLAATFSTSGDHKSDVPLDFKHLLTAVKVKIKVKTTIPQKLTSFVLKGVKGTGKHVLGTNTWTTEGDSKEYSLAYDKMTISKSEDGVLINDGINTFMMIPQTLTEDAALEFIFYDGSVSVEDERTIKLKCQIAETKEFGIGTTKVYTLIPSQTDYVVTLDPQSERFGSTTFKFLGSLASKYTKTGLLQTAQLLFTDDEKEIIGFSDEPNQITPKYYDTITLTADKPEKTLYAVWHDK